MKMLKEKLHHMKSSMMDNFKVQIDNTKEQGIRIDKVIYYYAIYENGKPEIIRIVYPDIEKLAKTHEFVGMLDNSIPILRRM